MGNPNRRALGSHSSSLAKAPKNPPHPQVASKAESAAASSAAAIVPPPPHPAQPEAKKSALRPDSAPFVPNVTNGKFNTFGVYVAQDASGKFANPASIAPTHQLVHETNVSQAVKGTFATLGSASSPQPANVVQGTNGTFANQRVQDAIRTMPPPQHRLQHPLPPRPPPVASMATPAASTALIAAHPLAVTTSRRPYVTVERKEKSLREIVITSSGVFRNAHMKSTRYFPDGQTFVTFHDEFDPQKYDFVAFFRTGMNRHQQAEFLRGNGVEIIVEMDPLMAMAEPEGKGKGKATLAQITAQESTATVIDSIKLMGPDFGRMVQKLTITLNFIEPADRTQIGVPVGPQQESPAFKFIEELVKELHNFEGSLKSVTINLGVPQTNEKPFTMPQVMFMLPFYDLGFVDWVCCFSHFLTYETHMCEVANYDI
jgi:hypothetical protein